ncbi:nitroreductase family deazaflavin-dependent oxidoreductase [Microlunatus parietis]|uniref:Deazaflavin-dependent oxidoreductase (Nitroreductase family) n=1 Tax=Microlunatus parietis TaxID=682979 RepID=A0A7Y9L6Q4_9ACTN|nr:nitroreductase family deazaflavin-dependent oxidoreductase [Microlunatus parietis]NYE69044.1 deazaflavin-dependent oxidoreductase (nitroreductase family) [Microlunatus parietis]
MTMPPALKALGPVINPVLVPLARRMPTLAVLHHVGRRSGRRYRTPVQAYRTEQGFLIGLVYDSAADWARNLEANGSGELTRSGRTYRVSAPTRLAAADALPLLPGPAAWMMRLVRVEEFVALAVPADARPEKLIKQTRR